MYIGSNFGLMLGQVERGTCMSTRYLLVTPFLQWNQLCYTYLKLSGRTILIRICVLGLALYKCVN